MCLPYFIILRDDFTRQGDMQFCVNQTICQCVLLIHAYIAPKCTLLYIVISLCPTTPDDFTRRGRESCILICMNNLRWACMDDGFVSFFLFKPLSASTFILTRQENSSGVKQSKTLYVIYLIMLFLDVRSCCKSTYIYM